MGFTPAQVDEMSLFEFISCKSGYDRAHGGSDEAEPMSSERARELGIVGF